MQKVLWIAIFYYIYKKIKSLGLSEKQLLSYCRQIARKSNKINSPQFNKRELFFAYFCQGGDENEL